MMYAQLAIVGGLVGMLGYGIADFLAKKAIDRIGNFKTLFYTQLFGLIFLIPYLIKDSSLPIFSILNILYVLFFGVANAIGYLMLYKSFEVGKMSIVSPISASYAILTAIISFLLFGETFSTMKIVAIASVSIGIIFCSTNFADIKRGFGYKDISKGVPQALLFFLIAGTTVPLWQKFISGDGWFIWVVLARLITSVFLFIYMLAIKHKQIIIKGKSIVTWLIFVSLFEAAAYFGSSWGLHSAVNATSIVASITSAYPLPTILLAHMFLKERVAFNQYLGIAIIIGGLVLIPFV